MAMQHLADVSSDLQKQCTWIRDVGGQNITLCPVACDVAVTVEVIGRAATKRERNIARLQERRKALLITTTASGTAVSAATAQRSACTTVSCAPANWVADNRTGCTGASRRQAGYSARDVYTCERCG